jgi:diguanylate cyclase (GGDEF)-like protein/PAS domain S-box-containing protein
MKNIFSVPEFTDPGKQRRANILVVTQFAAILMIVVIMIISVFLAPDHYEVIFQAGVGGAAIILSYYLLQKGKLDAAGWTVVILGWLILTLDLAFISGIRGVNVLGQVLIVMFAGLAINGKSALYITFINMTANLIVLYLEQNGILAHPAPLPADIARWSIQTIYTSLAAVYIWRADTIIKRTLLKSQTTADRYRALFEWTNDGVIILDLNWHLLSSNAQASELLEYSVSEFKDLEFSAWFPIAGIEGIEEKLIEILEGKEIPTFEHVLYNRSGDEIPVELCMTVVPDNLGNPQHIQLIFRDITLRKEYEKNLIYQASHDPLTNLPNRMYFEDRYLQVQNQHTDDQSLVAVFYIDIDDFKSVNDLYGHSVGDQVLKELGIRLLGAVRESDTVARIGGDEFVIILENIQQKDNISTIAEKIIQRVSHPIKIGNDRINISVSIGINWTEKCNLPDVDLILTSDMAMYQVKKEGKNAFRYYEKEVHS